MTCTCYDPTVFGHACGTPTHPAGDTLNYSNYYRLAETLTSTAHHETITQLARQIAETTSKLEKLNQTMRNAARTQ